MSANAESKPDVATEASSTTKAEEPAKDASYTEMASLAASNAAGSATTAAAGVKDSVFSMFGGGAKKEKKEEPDVETEDRSGSSKAKKDAEAAEAEGAEEGVSLLPSLFLPLCTHTHTHLRTHLTLPSVEIERKLTLWALIILAGRWRARISRSAFRARGTLDRESGDEDERGAGRADVQDARQAVQI